jgi:hypothetical protein
MVSEEGLPASVIFWGRSEGFLSDKVAEDEHHSLHHEFHMAIVMACDGWSVVSHVRNQYLLLSLSLNPESVPPGVPYRLRAWNPQICPPFSILEAPTHPGCIPTLFFPLHVSPKASSVS